MALPRGAVGLLRFVIAVFPGHTHLLLSILTTRKGHTFTSQYMRFGHIAYPQKPLIIANSGVFRGSRCLKVVQSLLQRVYARSKSSG